jgi:ribosomal-protein-alanine N-acetyltransferase
MLFSDDLFCVRKLKEGDISDFYDLLSSKVVMQYVKPVLNFNESKDELKRFISYYDSPEKFYYIWAIVDISNKQFLGICGVYLNHQKEFEIACRLREKYWGQGIGKATAKALIAYCKTTLGIKELVAYVDKRNLGSLTILKKFMKLAKDDGKTAIDKVERKFTLTFYAPADK